MHETATDDELREARRAWARSAREVTEIMEHRVRREEDGRTEFGIRLLVRRASGRNGTRTA
jgi:hypothetical protein